MMWKQHNIIIHFFVLFFKTNNKKEIMAKPMGDGEISAKVVQYEDFLNERLKKDLKLVHVFPYIFSPNFS